MKLARLAFVALTLATTGCVLPPGLIDAGTGTLTGGSLGNIRTNLDPVKTTVSSGESIRLWVDTSLPASGLSYRWTATSGSLSSSSGQTVTWTAGAAGTARITCVITSGSDSGQAEYRFTVR